MLRKAKLAVYVKAFMKFYLNESRKIMRKCAIMCVYDFIYMMLKKRQNYIEYIDKYSTKQIQEKINLCRAERETQLGNFQNTTSTSSSILFPKLDSGYVGVYLIFLKLYTLYIQSFSICAILHTLFKMFIHDVKDSMFLLCSNLKLKLKSENQP